MTKYVKIGQQRKTALKKEGNKGFKKTERLYKNIRYFKDTVLFEYSFLDASFYLPANASSQIDPLVLGEILGQYIDNPPGKEEMHSLEFQMGKMGEPYYWCGCKLFIQWGEGKKPVRLVGKLQDMSIMKAREEQLLLQSRKDGLTGVFNKTAFQYMVEQELKKGEQGWLCMLDIDNFKDINDRFGHLAGDRILTELGRILCSVFPEPELVGRAGGDEFVIYAKQENMKERAEFLLEKVRFLFPETTCRLSISIGVVLCEREEDHEYQHLFSKADQVMYCAKLAGKNRIVFFDEAVE